MYRLVEIRNGVRGKEFVIKAGKNLIGRMDPNNNTAPDIDLESLDAEAKVSRKHALIFSNEDLLELEDLNSLNGTYVNRGDKLRSGIRQVLKAGDEVVFGKTFLLVEKI